MKDIAIELRHDRTIWERETYPDGTKVLLVEESYYEWIIKEVENLQKQVLEGK